jgi:hypothetical protein
LLLHDINDLVVFILTDIDDDFVFFRHVDSSAICEMG